MERTLHGCELRNSPTCAPSHVSRDHRLYKSVLQTDEAVAYARASQLNTTLGPGDVVSEAFDDVIREYIAFVNQQVGAYMDALAGFAGHYARVERQVHRVNRPVRSEIDSAGQQVVVWASYEDPTKPDVIHNRIIRAQDYLAANAKDGSNEQQHAKAIVVFLFTYWEDEIRPRLATAKGVTVDEIRCDALGDLRILRNVILHAKSIMRSDKHAELRKLSDLFAVDQPIHLSCESMQKIFVVVKQDCGRLLFEWLGVTDAPLKPEAVSDIAIQKSRRPNQA